MKSDYCLAYSPENSLYADDSEVLGNVGQSSKKANLMTGAVAGTVPLESEGSVFRVLGPSHMDSCLSPVGRDSSNPK